MSDAIRDIIYAHQRRGTLTAACMCGALQDDGLQPSGIATQRHWEHVSRVIASEVDRKWTDWLASTGYGVDYSHREDPPTTLTLLADAYVRMTGEEDREAWSQCIAENTRALTAFEPPPDHMATPGPCVCKMCWPEGAPYTRSEQNTRVDLPED